MIDSTAFALISRPKFYKESDSVNSNNSTTDESLFVNNSTSNPITHSTSTEATEIAQNYSSQFDKIAYLIKEGQIDEAFALKDEVKATIATKYPNCDPETVYDKAFTQVNNCTPEEFIESSEFISIEEKGKADGRWFGLGALFGFDAPTKDEILAREYGVELSDLDKKEYEKQRRLHAGLSGALFGGLGLGFIAKTLLVGTFLASPIGIMAVTAACTIGGLLISHFTKDDFSKANSEQSEIAQEDPELKSTSESIDFPEELQAQEEITLEDFSSKQAKSEVTQKTIEETIENVAQENFKTTLDEQTVENIAQEVIIEDVPEVILEEIVEDKVEEEIEKEIV